MPAPPESGRPRRAPLPSWPWGSSFDARRTAPPFTGRVLQGDQSLGDFDAYAPQIYADIRGSEPLTLEMDPIYEAGSAYFSLTTRGVPTDEAFEPVQAGLEVERTLLSRDDGSLAGAVEQGDLVVLRTRVRSLAGPIENVVVEALLPSGLEIENPRLETTETLSWVTDATRSTRHTDLRDDRALLFVDLPANSWQTFYTVLRAVTPGTFRLPPIHAEAMYDPALRATGQRGELEVRIRE